MHTYNAQWVSPNQKLVGFFLKKDMFLGGRLVYALLCTKYFNMCLHFLKETIFAAIVSVTHFRHWVGLSGD